MAVVLVEQLLLVGQVTAIRLLFDRLPQSLFRAKIMVDQALGDATAAGDQAHRRAFKPFLNEEFLGRLKHFRPIAFGVVGTFVGHGVCRQRVENDGQGTPCSINENKLIGQSISPRYSNSQFGLPLVFALFWAWFKSRPMMLNSL